MQGHGHGKSTNLTAVATLAAVALSPALLSGCAATDDSAAKEAVHRIGFRQTGGFAGVDDRLVISRRGLAKLTTRDNAYRRRLSKARHRRLLKLLRRVPFDKLKRSYEPKQPLPDAFRYEVSYGRRRVAANEAAVPKRLRPALNALSRLKLRLEQPRR
ncbi:MAG: hypothetical protein M3301_02460 [Chloroflexota bacterium]|nr:hypothetical protein [Chloroflexota bacterium]